MLHPRHACKTTKRVGIYARVSTTDKGQDPENQLAELREYSKRRGFSMVGEFVDRVSGRDDNRPRYRELLELARRRRVDVVLAWRYDRFARSLSALVSALSEFQARGVDFISHQEDVDTTTPHGKLFFDLVSGFAEFESSLISERVRAGGPLRLRRLGRLPSLGRVDQCRLGMRTWSTWHGPTRPPPARRLLALLGRSSMLGHPQRLSSLAIREKNQADTTLSPATTYGVSTPWQPDRFIGLWHFFQFQHAQSPGGSYHPARRPPCNDRDRAAQVLTGSIETVKAWSFVDSVASSSVFLASGLRMARVSRLCHGEPFAGLFAVHGVWPRGCRATLLTGRASVSPADVSLSPPVTGTYRSRIAVSAAGDRAKACEKSNEYGRSLAFRV